MVEVFKQLSQYVERPAVLPRHLFMGEGAFMASFKRIGFDMAAISLAKQIVDEVAQWRDVQVVYPDVVKWASALPPTAVLTDTKGQPFTSTYWTKKQLGLEDSGYTGKGVKVAVVDTGCRNHHPQMAGVHIMSTMSEKGGTGYDMNGHGTWVNSCIAGKKVVDPTYGAPLEGMAPDVDLYSIQALGFVIGMGASSDTIQALNECRELGVDLVNLSLGGESVKDEDNPEAVAIDALVSEGIIPVCAAGNSGPGRATISSPGCVYNSLTVGSINIEGGLSDFSSRGPTEDNHIKPDVTCYGERIDSGLVGYLDYQIDRPHMHYGILSGTSMSTPHAVGVLSHMDELYKERNLVLDVPEVKTMMASLSYEKNNDTGWGLLDWHLMKDWIETQHG